jgi:hypothetical protein
MYVMSKQTKKNTDPQVSRGINKNKPVDVILRPRTILIKIYLSELLAYSTTITVFGDKLEKVSENSRDFSWDQFSMDYRVTSGKYIIRLRVNGRISDTHINVYDDVTFSVGNVLKLTDYQLKLPELYSSAPLQGELSYASSHEYYTTTAVRISEKNTFVNFDYPQPNCGLFIFLRFSSRETYQKEEGTKDIWNKFKLLDYIGRPLIVFPNHSLHDGNDIENSQTRDGYLGFSALLRPGMYFLQYDDVESRTIPVYVYANWYTQLFMTIGEQPLFGSLRIFISKYRRFDPYEKLHYYIDICLDKINNGDFTLDRHLLEKIGSGKWDSPMLGLLGAYIYLQSSETKNDALFQTIVNNLQSSILSNSRNSPDIWALNILSYKHFSRKIYPDLYVSCAGLPMLRPAFDAIRQAATIYPDLIKEGDILDHVAENQSFDSAYNTFVSLDPKLFIDLLIEDKNQKVSTKKDILDSLDNTNEKFNNLNVFAKIEDEGMPSISSVKSKLPELLKNRAILGRSGGSIVNLLVNDPSLNDFQIADHLKLPVNTVVRLRKELGI